VAPRPDIVEAAADGTVRTITLPDGPLTAATASALADVVTALVEDRSVRVVVVRGGADFCVGPADDLDPVALGVDPAACLARLRVPVVAAVRGRCTSVGLELVLAADLRIAAPGTTFALDDVTRSGRLPCWGGTQRLPRAVGVARATSMLLLGTPLDAEDAVTCGFCWDVAADLDAATADVVAGLQALGPLALEFAKDAVHRGAELPLRDGLRLEGDLNTLLATSADRAEGLAAFFTKRPADFAGR
jgi:enoyl-CoA hydratase/carnithine racemase